MTNTFFSKAKQIISEFISETRESFNWAKTELLRQYHLSILKEIGETYPDVAQYTETAIAIIDETFDCPDFVEAPDDGFGLPDTYERTNIQSNFAIDDPAFETEEEVDAFKFAEKMEELRKNTESLVYANSTTIDDGLNEPDYPYDTEPSA